MTATMGAQARDLTPASPLDDDVPAFDAPAPGLYRHYKGGWYEVVGAARCSETLQGMALYRPLYGEGLKNGALWVRPVAMFLEEGFFANLLQPRFARWRVQDVALDNLPATRAVVAHLHTQGTKPGIALDTTMRAPPPEPTDCCERGCNGCVWEGFYRAMAHWRADALALLAP